MIKGENIANCHHVLRYVKPTQTPEGEMVGALLRDIIPDTDIYAVIAG